MSDNKKTFHEWALESILFKGRYDWYFCFLKAEKIAYVLALLSEKVVHDDKRRLYELVDEAADLPHMVAHFAAGDVAIELLLADVFSLITEVRLSGARGLLARDTAGYIAQEYEQIAQKMASGNQLSPFISPQDFSVPEFLLRPKAPEALPISDIHDPARIGQQANPPQKKQEQGDREAPKAGRRAAILHFVIENKAVSIKDICMAITDCSEKTVQRELNALIGEGLIKREGERRWSVYKPA